uniref:cytosolic phospholipase A2 isoform X1 n=2 Tax=Myxine glutinosa TaxID=7769 RepID=UPI00358E2DC2
MFNSIQTGSSQFIMVPPQICHKLTVKVVRAEGVTKGKIGDLMDTPDPYVVLRLPTAAETEFRTRHLDNDVNPQWNETFSFLVDMGCSNVLQVILMDANYTVDEKLGEQVVHICNDSFPLGEVQSLTITFNKVTKVFLELFLEICSLSDLRFSIHLCPEEKTFRKDRKNRAMPAMTRLLGPNNAPRNDKEVPIVAVLGSGGGFRAMIGLAGVFKALAESGVLDCTTYVAGLSGSSWYLSTLYSHPDWPKKGVAEINEEVKVSASHSRFYLLRPSNLTRYVQALWSKRSSGQPVTFTDIFGLLIGETLIGKRMDKKLSDMCSKVAGGQVPLPLFTCLHVKPDVSEIIYADWMEFSPYEIGMSKYGTFMPPRLFGSKFFKGIAVKTYDEYPLHFLMGVWGSAFSILFNRVFRFANKHSTSTKSMEEEIDNLQVKNIATQDENDSDEDELGAGSISSMDHAAGTTWVQRTLHRLVGDTTLFTSREGRAGKVFNFMRGMLLGEGGFPSSPLLSPGKSEGDGDFAVADPDEFDQIHEPLDVRSKKIHVVDSGLTFNLPFPLVLRPQRSVDVILSFDFSARPSDSSRPFKDLLLARKWAKMHKMPFPHIDEGVFDREGLRECYVFAPKDTLNEPNCPIVLHFVLANINFRRYKAPGVLRNPEEKDFADFEIFDDPDSPYSTFNFHYSRQAFQRLHDLMEFNTLNNLQMIKDALSEGVRRMRENPRGLLSLFSLSNWRLPVNRKRKLSSETDGPLLHFSTPSRDPGEHDHEHG